MGVTLTEWVRLLRSEYLAEFIGAGGAAVKIAVVPPGATDAVMAAVEREGASQGYLAARVDAAETRVSMVDRIFFAVSRQVDWDAATDYFLRGLLRENGIRVADAQSLAETDVIAEQNGRLRMDLIAEISRLISHHVLEDAGLANDFRTAVALLCQARVNPQNVSPTDAELVLQWLRGEKCSLTALKRLRIYQRIARHNARLMLGSLARWLREAGYGGLLLLLDLTAVVADPAPGEIRFRYTRNSVLDTYEVLRQFIDETDETEHLMVVAVAGPGLVDDPKRSVDNYTALKMRTADEVRDRDRPNPLNVMVRLDVEGDPLCAGRV